MGLLDRFKRTHVPASNLLPQPWTGWYYSDAEYLRILGMGPGEMWRTQPYLRTVVTFLARNVAQLGLHTFERVNDTDRQRVHDGVAAVLARPNQHATTFELVYGLVADLALYDRGYWLLGPDEGQYLTRLPVSWVEPGGEDLQAPEWFEVRNRDGKYATVPAERVLYFHGWNPDNLATGATPVAALQSILAEQVQAARYREMVWQRGGKVGAVLTRPPEAPEWSPDARRQFKADWDAKFTGNGPEVGGTPMLEDGMRLERVDFSAKEMEYIEGSRLALNTVASVYHVNPTMIGLLDNANYSNVREFRRMLYGDTLGPIIAMIENRINAFLVPRYDERADVYVEFNIREKLQGNFEEQVTALQASVGAPWMTRNEARAVLNLPAVEDGDELVTPLNVLIGDQASPVNTAPEPAIDAEEPDQVTASGPVLLKTRAQARQTAQIAGVLRRYFARQRDADQYAKTGDPTQWDAARWDRELSEDLAKVAVAVVDALGQAETHALGFPGEAFDTDRAVRFLAAAAERRARNINLTTKGQLDAQWVADKPNPGHVYRVAINSRAGQVAVGLGTFLAGFATHEAAAQIARANRVTPSKTWVAGPNSRPEHAALNGQTVPLDAKFTNGQGWPGDVTGDPTETAGCTCTLRVTLTPA